MVDAMTAVQDGKVFYEIGKLVEAEAKFKAALKLNPDNAAANYYLNLINAAQERVTLKTASPTQ